MDIKPIIKKKKAPYYIIWIIPIISLLIAGWLYMQHQKERGTDITVLFDSLEGIEADKTKLMYRGTQLGVVTKVSINPQNILQGMVTINVFPPADNFVTREGSQFYKVEPKVGVTGISGLGTLLSGSYIRLYPPEIDTQKLLEYSHQYNFTASNDEPTDMTHSGYYIYLESDEALTSSDTPILYKGHIVGKLLEGKMNNGKLTYIGLIESPYVNLIKKTSRFWITSGVDVHASLAGVNFKMGSLANVIAGGVTFSSPEDGEVLHENYKVPFKLYSSQESLSLDTQMIALKAKKGFNLDPELNAIYYRGVKAGKMQSIDYDPALDETTIYIQLKTQYVPLLNENAHFWIVEPKINLQGVQGLDAIPSGAYLTFDSALGGKAKSDFILYETPPAKRGLTYHLTADNVGTLKVGTPVSMKGVEMGIVTDIRFDKNMTKNSVDVLIYERFNKFVNSSTSFYVQRAVEVEASFKDITLKTGTLENFLMGGIEFETFDPNAKPSNLSSKLYTDRASLEKEHYLASGGKRYILESETVGSLDEGSVVYYRKFPAGKVIKSQFNPKNNRVEIEIYIEPNFTDKINSNTIFYEKSGVEVEASLSGVKVDIGAVDTILRGAIAFNDTPGGNPVKYGHHFSLYDNLYHAENKFTEIVLTMEKAFGTKIGSSVIYKGLKIGEVKSQQLKDGSIEAHLRINETFAPLLVEDTRFWIESFHADIQGIKNVSTAITGSEIHLRPGLGQKASTLFELSPAAPPPTFGKEGLRIVAIGSIRSSLDVDSPVYYRQVPIGKIESYHLSKNGNKVEFTLFIDPCYKTLIRENSIIYLPSAIGMDVSLFGAKIKTETLQTMINGGMGIINPEEISSVASEGQSYKLENDVKEEWFTWQPKYPIQLDCKPEGVF